MNYFNYYTEIEEHFQQARGSGLFMLSPLDWALIEAWREAEIPLESVLKGIERAFEKYHKRKGRRAQVNSLAYCAQEVLTAAEEKAGAHPAGTPEPTPDFGQQQIARHLRTCAEEIERALEKAPPPLRETLSETARALRELHAVAEGDGIDDLQAADQRLSVLEERMIAAATQAIDIEEMLAVRTGMERELAPYRSKMRADQLAMLERQYLARSALERARLPRIGLFYAQ